MGIDEAVPGSGGVPLLAVYHFGGHAALNEVFGWEKDGVVADEKKFEALALIRADDGARYQPAFFIHCRRTLAENSLGKNSESLVPIQRIRVYTRIMCCRPIDEHVSSFCSSGLFWLSKKSYGF